MYPNSDESLLAHCEHLLFILQDQPASVTTTPTSGTGSNPATASASLVSPAPRAASAPRAIRATPLAGLARAAWQAPGTVPATAPATAKSTWKAPGVTVASPATLPCRRTTPKDA